MANKHFGIKGADGAGFGGLDDGSFDFNSLDQDVPLIVGPFRSGTSPHATSPAASENQGAALSDLFGPHAVAPTLAAPTDIDDHAFPAPTMWNASLSFGERGDFASAAAPGSSSAGASSAAATIPSGAEGEVAYLSGITNTARVASTSFAMWQGNNPATYGTTGYSEKWGSPTLSTSGTAGGNVTYWFDTSSHWTTTEQNALLSGLQLWSAEANITFSLAASSATAQFDFVRGATGSGAYETFTAATPAAAGSVADGTAITAVISIDTSQPYWQVGTSFDNAGGYAWQTLVHEEGHLIGLGHGGPYNGSVTPSTQQFSAYDTRLWTLMSYIEPNDTSAKFYNSYPVTGTSWGYNSQGYMYESTTPMMMDILAAQRIYGVPTSGPLTSGGQTFGFHSNITGLIGQYFDFTVDQHPVVTLWDSGLNNTLDLSGWSQPATISLVPGTFSSAHGMVNNIGIAGDTRIDNAVGGSGNDTITGNAYDNTIRGGLGNDIINGGGGIDTAIFSGVFAAYTLTDLGGGSVRVSGPDGTDTLTSIERLQFDDQTVTWPGLPNLTAGSVALKGTVISYSVNNIGVGASVASTAAIYLSTDATITTSDTLLATHATPALAAGGADLESASLTFPTNLTPGTYYIGVLADYAGQVAESNETDNASAALPAILGNNSANTLSGTSSNDVMFGFAGNDTLNGGAGADVLAGGAGADILTGGPGADTFVFDQTALTDATATTPIFDRITDYDQGNTGVYSATEGDQIDLSALLSTAYNHGSGQAVGALVRVVTSGTGASLQIDADGTANGTAWTTIARLDGVHAGNGVNVILDPSLPAGSTITVQQSISSNFDGDTHSDILFQNTDGTPAVWLMNGTGVATFGNSLTNPGSAWHEIDAGDFNGDGKADILFQNTDGTPAVWLMNGTNPSTLGPSLHNPGASWHAIATGDFDGDGKSDILFQNTDGTPAVWLMNGTNATTFGPSLPDPGSAWHAVAAADFDGDGKSDILFQNTDGTPAVWLMNGTNVNTMGPSLHNPGSSWHIVAAADFNGDGQADILWQNADGTPAVWLMNGTSVTTYGDSLHNPGTAWHIVGAADFNGDGKADIVWQNADGTPAVWLMNGTQVDTFGPSLHDPGPSWHII